MADNLYQNYSKDEKSSQKSGWTPYMDDDENQSEEDERTMEEPKGKSKKKYSVIPQNVREKFIKRVLSKEVTIKEAAKEFGLKFSTSKAILQTYKKEGRIGKKKNRERKTKVVNAVFIANFTQGSSFPNSLPLGPLNELKNMNFPPNTDVNLGKSFETDPKLAKGLAAGGYNKPTQTRLKEFGNDFLREFIEKNFSQNRLPPLNTGGLDRNFGSSNEQNQMISSANFNSTMNTTSFPAAKHFLNFGNNNVAAKPNTSAFNSLSSFTANSSLLIPQKVSSINSDSAQPGGLNQFNIPSTNQNKGFNQNQTSFLGSNKRAFHTYEKDLIPDFSSKEQISDISVKKFKSGEDNLWDFDMDKSKKDLEDFIYKTHSVMKNNLEDNKILNNFADFP